MHSITTLARLSGVKQETIRTWERRYGVVQPERDPRGRRVYSDQDAQRLRVVAALVRAGHQIGEVADWSDQQCARILSQTAVENPARAQADRLLEELIDLIKSDDTRRFEHLVSAALTGLPPETAMESVIAPLLARMGEMWHAGEIGVDVEHERSAIVKRQLLQAIAYLSPSANGPTILFSTLSEEWHEFGALMACFVAASARRQCRYLGPSTPARDLANAAERLNVDAVALSLVQRGAPEKIESELEILAEQTPPKVQLILGVAAAARPVDFRAPERLLVVDSLEEFLRLLSS